MTLKKGQIWINTGFETVYKGKFYHSIVRILKIEGNDVLVKSVADNLYGQFDFGYTTFILRIDKNFTSGHFRPYKSGDIERFKTDRLMQRLLYGYD